MAELTRRCFYMAKLLNGPTQLNIPRDFFYGDLDCEIYKSGDVCYGPGPEEQIKQAAEMLSMAKFPVILAGGGVSQSKCARRGQGPRRIPHRAGGEHLSPQRQFSGRP
jgi:sulfoacetaldehyde acetyltransferase